MTIDSAWRSGEDFGERDTAWTKRFFAALGRFREGVYVNFLGDDDRDRVCEAYGDCVFRHNRNIRPRAGHRGEPMPPDSTSCNGL